MLVKNIYSTINPTDIATYRAYKTEGATIGSDGCGIIQEVGEGVDPSLKGKKVAFLSDAWGKYCVKDQDMLIILDDDLDLTQAANSCVNPLTVLAMLEISQKRQKAKAVISLAASS